jgi:hypothetical protein
VAVRPP